MTKKLFKPNKKQKIAITWKKQHCLVLAGAGCGKTETIVWRASHLISTGTPADRIQILTFTNRAAKEIKQRILDNIGEEALCPEASTFHKWCFSIIANSSARFGFRFDKVVDPKKKIKELRSQIDSRDLPIASEICSLYSYARNTCQTLDAVLRKKRPDLLLLLDQIAQIISAYESWKQKRPAFMKNYRLLDFDDFLEIVANQLESSPETCSWVAKKYDYILVDEMQDTNLLQWKILDLLKDQVNLFCVGDDAQSIYGFRGADFNSIHRFKDKVKDSVILQLDENYRSTQNILNVSNWLLKESTLNYNKELKAYKRLNGIQPQLHNFLNGFDEGDWIARDLVKRKKVKNKKWNDYMILVRTKELAKPIESALVENNIPYRFIGGTNLLDLPHVNAVLSVLRIVANPSDEMEWKEYLVLWDGIGEVTAGEIVAKILKKPNLAGCINILENESKIPELGVHIIRIVDEIKENVSGALTKALELMDGMLSRRYPEDWNMRKPDLWYIERLTRQHSSIQSFLNEYDLEPLESTKVQNSEVDKVTITTVHSAKGTECEICYLSNVSPGVYPSTRDNTEDEIEESRRVLYVALTRAKKELILTRYKSHACPNNTNEPYFLKNLPINLIDEHFPM